MSGQVIWQIGKFDRSPLEFSSAAPNELSYAVGKSDWKTEWPGRQGIKHPYKVTFPLKSLQGVYMPKLSALIEQPRVPVLQIDVRESRMVQHPMLDGGARPSRCSRDCASGYAACEFWRHQPWRLARRISSENRNSFLVPDE